MEGRGGHSHTHTHTHRSLHTPHTAHPHVKKIQDFRPHSDQVEIRIVCENSKGSQKQAGVSYSKSLQIF